MHVPAQFPWRRGYAHVSPKAVAAHVCDALMLCAFAPGASVGLQNGLETETFIVKTLRLLLIGRTGTPGARSPVLKLLSDFASMKFTEAEVTEMVAKGWLARSARPPRFEIYRKHPPL